MNWVTFGIAVWIALGLELGLRPFLGLSGTSIAPSFVVPVIVWVGLGVSQRKAVAVGMIAGLLLDLTRVTGGAGGGDTGGGVGAAVGYVVGPQMLGMAAAMLVVTRIRGGVIRRHPLSLGLLSVIAAAVLTVVFVAAMTLREAVSPQGDWRAWPELGSRLLGALYTGLPAVLLAWPLHRTEALWDLRSERIRRR